MKTKLLLYITEKGVPRGKQTVHGNSQQNAIGYYLASSDKSRIGQPIPGLEQCDVERSDDKSAFYEFFLVGC